MKDAGLRLVLVAVSLFLGMSLFGSAFPNGTADGPASWPAFWNAMRATFLDPRNYSPGYAASLAAICLLILLADGMKPGRMPAILLVLVSALSGVYYDLIFSGDLIRRFVDAPEVGKAFDFLESALPQPWLKTVAVALLAVLLLFPVVILAVIKLAAGFIAARRARA